MNGTLDGTVILVPPKSQNLYQSHSLTAFGQNFLSIFYPLFPDENHGKVKNRQTWTVIYHLYLLKLNKRIQMVKLPSVTCLKVENLFLNSKIEW